MTPPWAVWSPMRAAGMPPMRTVAEPLTMKSAADADALVGDARGGQEADERHRVARETRGAADVGHGAGVDHRAGVHVREPRRWWHERISFTRRGYCLRVL